MDVFLREYIINLYFSAMDVFLREYMNHGNNYVEQIIVERTINRFNNNCDTKYTLLNFIVLYKKRINRPIYRRDAFIIYKISELLDKKHTYHECDEAMDEINLDDLNGNINSIEGIDLLLHGCGSNKLNLNFKYVDENHNGWNNYKKLFYYYMSTFLEDEPNDIKIALKY
jgi:hypothetical protein